ncbi:hypothetical protein OOZ19_09430 [Saccharopolyspora sp. NFXS83]|nr:hypothetical protein [Saccharopolyspora sp. NFXS83]MCX2730462.1 hypothetical protein [Saccharopolyspora sp. NFXS83]
MNLPELASVRDSKLGVTSPTVVASTDAFSSLLGAVEAGRLDR